MDSKEKKTMGCLPTKDGRVHFTMQVAATLSVGKTAYVCAFLCALTAFILAPFLGWARDAAMQRRVQKLEEALGKRLTWVSAHQSHLKKHLLQRSFSDASLNTDSSLQTDGRRHLWVEPGSYSKLAQALQGAGIDTTLPLTDDHYMCGEQEVTEDQVLRKTLALAAITWKAPLSLRNSMLSWQKSGLLDIIDERMLFINSASQEDFDIAKEFDFDVYTTEERNGNIMAGPALGYLVGNTTADYVLFMEKDFVLSSDRETMLKEMYASVHAMSRGVEVYRLRGKTDHPAEGMPDCCVATEPPQCPFHSEWKSAGYFSDHMNWLRIFCVDDPVVDGKGQVVQCTSVKTARPGPSRKGTSGGSKSAALKGGEDANIPPTAVDSYCFSAGNSNWSNNPVVFPKDWFNSMLREVSFLDWERNNMFEFNVMMNWLPWRPHARVCVSYQGIFTHHEIDQ